MFRALAFVAAGVVVAGAALALFREYGRAFSRDARATMTLEVFLQFLRMAGPGWLAALCLFGGVWMIGIGVYLAVGEVAWFFR
jgi:hypothetical protein